MAKKIEIDGTFKLEIDDELGISLILRDIPIEQAHTIAKIASAKKVPFWFRGWGGDFEAVGLDHELRFDLGKVESIDTQRGSSSELAVYESFLDSLSVDDGGGIDDELDDIEL